MVDVAADVSGLVANVEVHDTQPVRVGEVLLRIDTQRFVLALASAQAMVASNQAAYEEAEREAKRQLALTNLSTSREVQQKAVAAAQEAGAAYQQAVANRNTAALNLTRSEVRAPTNGILTNFHLRPGDYIGDYITAGQAVTALVDTDSFYVVGYFVETKLSRIHVGDAAVIQLLGQGGFTLRGHVEGFAGGIANAQATAAPNLLPNVNPTFTWVRVAQRMPVRIALDHVPPQVVLVAGRTATVSITSNTENQGR